MIKCYELTNRLPTGLMDNAISRVAFATENLKMDLMVLHCSTKLWTHLLECKVLQLKFSWSRASVCWRITRKWFNRQLSDDWARLWIRSAINCENINDTPMLLKMIENKANWINLRHCSVFVSSTFYWRRIDWIFALHWCFWSSFHDGKLSMDLLDFRAQFI